MPGILRRGPKVGQICHVHIFKADEKGKPVKPERIPCRPAEFGSVNSFDVGGTQPFVLSDEDEACGKEITCGGGKPCKGKIVLAFRGKCGFYQKALNAMKAKARAIIIADSKPTGESGLMQLIRGQKEVDQIEAEGSIPVLSTLHEQGMRLKRMLQVKGNHALCGIEFSEHEGEHSWKHKIEEFQVHMKLQEKPQDPELWSRLVMALQSQGDGRAEDTHEAYQEYAKHAQSDGHGGEL